MRVATGDGTVSSSSVFLTELAAQARAKRSPSALRQFALTLEADPRAGARALLRRVLRRALALEQEERRAKRLSEHQRALHAAGARNIAGVDEVGVGAWAGPVVAAAVVLPSDSVLPGLNDSKKLTRHARERLAKSVREQAVAVGVGAVEHDDVDRLNVLRAGLLAMRRAVRALPVAPGHLLVDAHRVPGVNIPQTPLIGGDGRAAEIAAASVVAKVHRDSIMRALDGVYPGYGFAAHKGYGTRVHQQALTRAGACAIHRMSFAPVARVVELRARATQRGAGNA